MERKAIETFVDRSMAALTAEPGWTTDTDRALQRYQAVAAARRRHRMGCLRGVAACVAETVAVGQRPPAFTLTDASGQTVRLADFRGKVVLLNFWAMWCPPCKTEIPWFVEFQSKYEAAGLVVLGISMDEEGWATMRLRGSLGAWPVCRRRS